MDIKARNKIPISFLRWDVKTSRTPLIKMRRLIQAFRINIIKHLEKLNTQQGAVNISIQPNPRTDKKPVIATDNYNNILKEYDSIYAASKDLQIKSGIIIYSCKNMHKPRKRYTFCYKKIT